MTLITPLPYEQQSMLKFWCKQASTYPTENRLFNSYRPQKHFVYQ